MKTMDRILLLILAMSIFWLAYKIDVNQVIARGTAQEVVIVGIERNPQYSWQSLP